MKYTTKFAGGMSCSGNLSALTIAIHNYHEKYGSLPPPYLEDENGNPSHSWRVLVLEFLDKELYDSYRFDEPWNGPHNQSLMNQGLNRYFCYNDPDAKLQQETSYVVVVGPGTAFPGPQGGISFDDITGDRNKTLLLVEVLGSGINWLEPRDISLEDFLNAKPGSMRFASNDPQGPHVAMASGRKRTIGAEFDRRQFHWMATISGEDDP